MFRRRRVRVPSSRRDSPAFSRVTNRHRRAAGLACVRLTNPCRLRPSCSEPRACGTRVRGDDLRFRAGVNGAILGWHRQLVVNGRTSAPSWGDIHRRRNARLSGSHGSTRRGAAGRSEAKRVRARHRDRRIDRMDDPLPRRSRHRTPSTTRSHRRRRWPAMRFQTAGLHRGTLRTRLSSCRSSRLRCSPDRVRLLSTFATRDCSGTSRRTRQLTPQSRCYKGEEVTDTRS